ncbi:50S ribosomal protein L25 [Helcococcus kunzii]|uniref:50S ribosomal protein L25 n=1 Tax=Helcococcus kunzii TaxID=40091 RepID=UPI0024AD500E|nr:50S ribosomal protein L25 [Helcococcus kunzii]
MSEFKLNAERRGSTGTGHSRQLRAEKLVPAQLYQRNEENINLQVEEKDLDKIIETAGTSAIISLMIDGEEKNVLIREYQRHPFKNQYLHVDFLGVKMDELLRVSVPVVLLNRDDIKLQPSVLMQQLEEVEIETLPTNIPQQVELDVQNMQYGDTFIVDDIEELKDDKYTILTDLEEVVCTLVEPEEEIIEDEVEDVDAADVEVIGEEDDKDEESEEE